MTTTQAATRAAGTTTEAAHCHLGSGWGEYGACAGQCGASGSGYRSRRRYDSDFFVDPASPACADVVCAVAVVGDGTCTSTAGADCAADGVKFGIAFTAPTAEEAQEQAAGPLQVAVAAAIQTCLEGNCIGSFELESGRVHWDAENRRVVASQLSLLSLDSDSATTGAAILNFPVVQSTSGSSTWTIYDGDVVSCAARTPAHNTTWFAGFSLNTTSSTMADLVRAALVEVLDAPRAASRGALVDSWFEAALTRGALDYRSSLHGYVRPVKITFTSASDGGDGGEVATGYGSISDAPYLIVWGVVTAAVFLVFIGIAVVVVCRRRIAIARDSKNWQIWNSVPTGTGTRAEQETA